MRGFGFILVAAAALSVVGCGGGGSSGPPGSGAPPVTTPTPRATPTPTPAPTGPLELPTHVVVIVQENRSVDNLFNGLPGADTARTGLNSQGQTVQLQPIPLNAKYDVDHSYMGGFLVEFANGALNGWDKVELPCFASPCPQIPTAYGYVPQAQVAPYWNLAEQFAFADHVLQTNESSSFPAHQYLIAAQSGGGDADHLAMADSPDVPTGGCNVNNATVPTINMTEQFPGSLGDPIFPCLNYETIFDLLEAKGYTWRYYTPTLVNIWAAPIAVEHIWNSPQAANIVTPETQILTDIANHQLRNVSYVVPELQFSDHSGYSTLQGPDWVATITNAIGTDPYYWKNTTILVVWDDWGGWFDHYVTGHPADHPDDPFEFGFRVPLIAVSAYVQQRGFVDHTPRDFTAILGFIEHVFGLGSLNQRDRYTDDLSPLFNFRLLHPYSYTKIDTGGFSPSFFRFHKIDTRPIDD